MTQKTNLAKLSAKWQFFRDVTPVKGIFCLILLCYCCSLKLSNCKEFNKSVFNGVVKEKEKVSKWKY